LDSRLIFGHEFRRSIIAFDPRARPVPFPDILSRLAVACALFEKIRWSTSGH
jgi:hypothetical protein